MVLMRWYIVLLYMLPMLEISLIWSLRELIFELLKICSISCIKNRINRFVLTSTTALYGHAVNSSIMALHGWAIALRMSRCFPEPADLMTSYRLHRGVDAIAVNFLIGKGWIPKYGFEEVLRQYDDESSEILIPKSKNYRR